jgi:hypothetical protein
MVPTFFLSPRKPGKLIWGVGDLIRERVRAGLHNARAKGKKFGRPRSG